MLLLHIKIHQYCNTLAIWQFWWREITYYKTNKIIQIHIMEKNLNICSNLTPIVTYLFTNIMV